jgi:hypothetical protein
MSPVASRRRKGFLILTGVLAFALAGTRSVTPHHEVAARGCPPGYVSAERQASDAARERRAEVNGVRARAGAESDTPAGACRSLRAPERASDLLAVQTDSGRRARGGQAALKTGAYAAAVRQAEAMPAAAGGAWAPVGTGPLVADDARFGEVNGEGLADLNGRVADYAYDAAGNRLFAAVGEGGVWESDDQGGNWHSIGDSLPTQAVGGIAYNGGTLVIVTGDSVFGGGGTFAGLGAFRSTDGGATWQHASGVPSGVIAFKVVADPGNPNIFYAATGAGLFRSADGGASFVNVNLPVGPCAGKAPEAGCALANMVTGLAVEGPANAQSAGGAPGAVVAAVGWRAGHKQSPYGYVESPGNGIYVSPTGAPGSFVKGGDFPGVTNPGRIELGAATGAAQDHRYVYAMVADAAKFNGDPLDAGLNGTTPTPTNFGGVYVSSDFGATWSLMESAEEMVADAGSGSALNGTACAAAQYCPGVQSWYNQWIAPDPTQSTAAGVPMRLAFGLEEVWGAAGTPQNTHQRFEVVGPYFSGSTCLFLNLHQECPTTHSDPTKFNTTTHPDQHAGLWIPTASGVRLVAANDGGAYTQDLTGAGDPSPDNWGRGANQGFHTLLPYDAQIAKDGTIYAGLQDNGELKIQPDGRQFETYGGDGTFSAVDPDDSDIAYESTPSNAISKTTDGGQTWNSAAPPDDTYQFTNPFVMDPVDAAHLLTAGTKVWETTDGAGNWKGVYDLGTRTHPGDPNATAGTGDPDNIVSAIDVRGVGRALPSAGKATPSFTWTDGGQTAPGAANQVAGVDVPGTYADKPFTIAADEADRAATIRITWADGTQDWDLVVFRDDNGTLTEVGSSAGGPPANSEQVVLARPAPGNYVIRARNYAATGTFDGSAAFEPATAGDTVASGSAAYVAYCGYCDALNTTPFANGLATNVKPDGTIGKPGTSANWHVASRSGLPKRYITSVQMDPSNVSTVYVTLAGYSRRWLRPGVIGGAAEGADIGTAHVCKSTDAGETFVDVTGNLPDLPADFAIVRAGQLIVATDLGVYVSANTSGGNYVPLGSGLPAVPVLSLELKPKANASEPDTLIVATQGRGVYRLVLPDGPLPVATTAKAATAPCLPPAGGGSTPPGGSVPTTTGSGPGSVPGTSTTPGNGGGATACVASRALRTATATGAGRKLKLGFTRRVSRPVSIDVYRVSQGRRVLTGRLVARFKSKAKTFTWNGRANRKGTSVGDGYYFVRYTLREASGVADVRRIALRRAHGRWSRRPDFYGRAACATVRSFRLLRPVFGGSTRRALKIAVTLGRPAKVTLTVRRGKHVVKRYAAGQLAAGKTYRQSLAPKKLARSDYRVTLDARRRGEHVVRILTSRRI